MTESTNLAWVELTAAAIHLANVLDAGGDTAMPLDHYRATRDQWHKARDAWRAEHGESEAGA